MKVLFSFITGFFLSSLHAQSGDQNAKLILDKASAKIKSYKSLQVQFFLSTSGCQRNLAGYKKGNRFYERSEIYCTAQRSGNLL